MTEVVGPMQMKDIEWYAKQVAKSQLACPDMIDEALIILKEQRKTIPENMFSEKYDLFEKEFEKQKQVLPLQDKPFFTNRFNCFILGRMLIEYFSRIGNIRSMIGKQKAQDSKFYSDPQSYIAYKFKDHQPTSLTDFFNAKTYGRVGYTIQVTPPSITDVESVLVIESILLEGSVEQEVWNKRSSAKQQILQLLCKYIDNLGIDFSKYTKFVNMEIFDINDKRVLQLDSEGVIMKERKKEKAARLEEERLEQKKEMMKMQELERRNAERLEEERLNKKAEKEKEKEANKKRKEEEARKIKEEEKKKNAEVEELLGEFEEEPSPSQSKKSKRKKKTKKIIEATDTEIEVSDEVNAATFLQTALRAHQRKKQELMNQKNQKATRLQAYIRGMKDRKNKDLYIARAMAQKQYVSQDTILTNAKRRNDELIMKKEEEKKKKEEETMQKLIDDVVDSEAGKIVEDGMKEISKESNKQENVRKLRRVSFLLTQPEMIQFNYEGEMFIFRVSPYSRVYQMYKKNEKDATQAILNALADNNEMEKLLSIPISYK
tara:strand:+ start:1289 stop:2926 length:1638 start_codon:yes stop_codon:yes gene_type:complete